MSKIYNLISIISFSLAGLFFALAVFMWFKFKILKIIYDLTGRTERMEIEKIRENKASAKGEDIAEHLLDSSDTTQSTVADTVSGRKTPKTTPLKTTPLDDNETQLLDENKTEIIDGDDTQILDGDETEILSTGEIISDEENETEILSENDGVDEGRRKLDDDRRKVALSIGFVVEDSVDLHSSEEKVD